MRHWAGLWALVLTMLAPPTALAQPSGGASSPRGDGPSVLRAAQASEGNGSLPALPRQIGADFRSAFISKENWAIVGLGAAAAWGANHWDYRIAESSFNSEPREGAALDRFYEPGQALGGGAVQVGGAFAAYGLGRLLSKPGVEALGRDLVRAQVVAQTFTLALKVAVGRERPDHSNRRSFPSGHASASFATATVLHQRYGSKVGIPAYVLASYVASSRLNEGAHYLSDVIFGSALGIIGGRTATLEVRNARLSLVPAMSCGGAGLQLILQRIETPGPGDDQPPAGAGVWAASRR